MKESPRSVDKTSMVACYAADLGSLSVTGSIRAHSSYTHLLIKCNEVLLFVVVVVLIST